MARKKKDRKNSAAAWEDAYAVLAEGPGTLARLADFDSRSGSLPSDVGPHMGERGNRLSTQPAPAEPSLEPAAAANEPVPAGPPPTPSGPPSYAYIRMLEELSSFVAPEMARRLLDECLALLNTSASCAIPLNLRSAVVEHLPGRLAPLMARAEVSAVLLSLEESLMDMHAPRPGRRSASRPEMPMLPGVRSTNPPR